MKRIHCYPGMSSKASPTLARKVNLDNPGYWAALPDPQHAIKRIWSIHHISNDYLRSLHALVQGRRALLKRKGIQLY